MKKLLLLSCLLFLASCIDVDNFGEYWDKGGIDKYLIGNWILVRAPDKGRITVTVKDDVYHIAYSSREKYIARMLRAGSYRFLLLKEYKYRDEGSGMIVRYKINDGKVVIYEFDNGALAQFLKTNYPDTLLFYTSTEGSGVTVKLLNDETINILSSIPDNEKYWHISDVYSPM